MSVEEAQNQSFPPINPLHEFRLAATEARLTEQLKQIKDLEQMIRDNKVYYEKKIKEIETHYEAQERSRLKWGISTLGTIVTILGGIIWNYRGVIFRGTN